MRRRLNTVFPMTTSHPSLPKSLPLLPVRALCSLTFSYEVAFLYTLDSFFSPLYVLCFFFSTFVFTFSSSSSCGSSYFLLTPILPTPSAPYTHTALSRNVRKNVKDHFSLQCQRHWLSTNAVLLIAQVLKGSDGFTPCCHTSPG